MSLKKLGYSLLALASFVAGLVLISIQKNFIILNFNTTKLANHQTQTQTNFTKKNITLWFWQNEQWHSEQTIILWGQDSANNLTSLVQNWLALATEEQIIKNKINLQAALVSKNEQTAYLSFGNTLFNKNLSTYQKLLIIESLLKTIRTNQTGIQEIQFLVQHQIMQDSQLDFANPWPITGFLKN